MCVCLCVSSRPELKQHIQNSTGIIFQITVSDYSTCYPIWIIWPKNKSAHILLLTNSPKINTPPRVPQYTALSLFNGIKQTIKNIISLLND